MPTGESNDGAGSAVTDPPAPEAPPPDAPATEPPTAVTAHASGNSAGDARDQATETVNGDGDRTAAPSGDTSTLEQPAVGQSGSGPEERDTESAPPPPPGQPLTPRHLRRGRFVQSHATRRSPAELVELVREQYLLLIPIALVAIFGLLFVGWAIDNALHANQVHRNVSLAGHALGGATQESLPARVADVAEDAANQPVTVEFDGKEATATTADLGLTLDEQAVVDEAMAIGRREPLPLRPFGWFASIFSDRTVSPEYVVSETQMSGALQMLYQASASEETIVARSPQVELTDGAFAVVPGQPGRGLDLEQASEDLVAAVSESDPLEGEEVALTVGTTEVQPSISNEEAQELADRANNMTAQGLTLAAGGTEKVVPPEQLRQWITPVVEPQDALEAQSARPDAGGAPAGTAEATLASVQQEQEQEQDASNPLEDAGELSIVLDRARVSAEVPQLFSDFNQDPVNATVRLGGGGVEVVPSEPGRSCCGDDAAERIWAALQEGKATVELEAKVVEPEHTTEEVKSWGIVEPVGGSRGWRNGQGDVPGPRPGFTTWEACCGNRQHNIRTMADAVNGAVIPPGGTFSINEHVGARQCPPYREAGAIVRNEHVDECGGGTSQFGTTFFNAAFFAGLDITQYKAHSEYFGRYPRGREATMGAPGTGLDVALVNDTDYGVLIQTSYQADQLTVTMWSTQHIQAEQTGITESTSGNCDVVTTTRTRTYPDGSQETDSFHATYRPGEGKTC